jgi:virulence-associated protein VapD
MIFKAQVQCTISNIKTFFAVAISDIETYRIEGNSRFQKNKRQIILG